MIKAVFYKLLNTILNSVMGSGLFCGFITASTVGLGYSFVVYSFFKKDIQKRVAAIMGFLMGQFVMFTSIYAWPLHQVLVQPHNLIRLFLSSFFVQLFWTSLIILRKTEFLHPEDPIIKMKRKRRRVLRLQLDFMLNFFVQLCNSYLEPDSRVPRFVSIFLFRYKNENKILFVISSFVGWLIGHIFFMILFMKLLQFIIEWVHNHFFKS